MKIVVITSCTGEKKAHAEQALTKEDFEQGSAHVSEREKKLASHLLPAGDMYSGQQHTRLMQGVKALREEEEHEVDLWILSAGYGLIPADRKIAPYECTFSGMRKAELRSWARELNIPKDFRKVLGCSFDVGIVLLGNDYLEACDLKDPVELGGPTLFVCSSSTAEHVNRIDQARAVPLRNQEAVRFSCGLVSLKGKVGRRILETIGEGGNKSVDRFFDLETDVLGLLA